MPVPSSLQPRGAVRSPSSLRLLDSWRPTYEEHTGPGRHGSDQIASSTSRNADWPNSTIDHVHQDARTSGVDGNPAHCLGPFAAARAPESRTLPKNFATPLTCFYWHTSGKCTKSDNECWYAHYDTGCIAAAPVRVPGRRKFGAFHLNKTDHAQLDAAGEVINLRFGLPGTRANMTDSTADPADLGLCADEIKEVTAGKQATAAISDVKAQGLIRKREIELAEREIDFANKITEMQNSMSAFENSISRFYTVVNFLHENSAKARRSLEHSRDEVLDSNGTRVDQVIGIIHSFEDAIASMASVGHQLSDIEEYMAFHVAGREGMDLDGDQKVAGAVFPDPNVVRFTKTSML